MKTGNYYLFQKHGVNLLHLESRPSKQDTGSYDFFVACDDTTGGVGSAVEDLKSVTKSLTVMARATDRPTDTDTGTHSLYEILYI